VHITDYAGPGFTVKLTRAIGQHCGRAGRAAVHIIMPDPPAQPERRNRDSGRQEADSEAPSQQAGPKLFVTLSLGRPQ
jgi:hypothetical protein